MKLPIKLLSIFLAFILTACSTTEIEKDVVKENNVVITEEKSTDFPEIDEYVSRMLQATTQLSLKRNNIDDDTSSLLDDWTFAVNRDQTQDSTFLWNVITQKTKHSRIKAIFQWNGTADDDLILKYLLVGGDELVNDLDN